MKLVYFICLIQFCYHNAVVDCAAEGEELYGLLGVSRDATVKEIRKAFKSLAVKLHPDKNKDDANADAVFVKIAKAYEILKDPDTRKKYDLYGDTGESNNNNNNRQAYRSYSYYRDQFGLYDDDPLIVTLSKADYDVNILDKNQAWFVNFYSPNCHHCHDLAPVWKKIASDLEGVVRIAAVNCEEDWSLCYQLSIQSYPTLLYYEKEAHMYEGEKYTGPRSFEALKKFILSKVTAPIKNITRENWIDEGYRNQQWLLFLCADGKNCPESETTIKLSAMLEGLISVGTITDRTLAEEVYGEKKTSAIVFWKVEENSPEIEDSVEVYSIEGADAKEILTNVLDKLPNPKSLNADDFQVARQKLREGSQNPWLICFYLGTATDLDLQLKRLPALLPNFNLGLIHCGKNSALCSSLHVSRYPAWGVIKVGGAFELHYGRDVLHDVSAFARDSSTSTNFHALSPADFRNLVKGGGTWFIDWFAPWCPPCRKLMPELRKASQHFDSGKVQFGSIDCTLHKNLCAQQGIRSYPTVMLVNGSQVSHFSGTPNEDGIVQFVNDMINPLVVSLDVDTFARLKRKPENELWIVDFFAPWCSPCQALAAEWRSLAKQVKEFEQVRVASVDCVAYSDICSEQQIRSYPTIRLYPLGSKGLNSVAVYSGHRDALSLKRWILNFLPSPVEQLDAKEFRKQILTKNYRLPWLIDFYAPWCGHCINFEPHFWSMAEKLDRIVRSGKVDCEAERDLCREMRITGYPTVKLFLSPSEYYEISSQLPATVVQEVKRIISERHSGHDEL